MGFGILFLVYPLLGHLADVYLTRYRTLKVSYVILTIASCAAVVYCTVDIVSSRVFKYTKFHHHQTAVILFVLLTVNVMGSGLFEANAIQFGLDQLLEAPTPNLISFIHWYYWNQNVAGLVVFYAVSGDLAMYHKEYTGQNSTAIQVVERNLENFLIEIENILLVITNNYCINSFTLCLQGTLLHSKSWSQSFHKYLQSSQVCMEVYSERNAYTLYFTQTFLNNCNLVS